MLRVEVRAQFLASQTAVGLLFDFYGALGRDLPSAVLHAAQCGLGDAELFRESLTRKAAFQAKSAENSVRLSHSDTYRIGYQRRLQYPMYRTRTGVETYDDRMNKKPEKSELPAWGAALRDHVRTVRGSWTKIAGVMGRSEAAIRHWCNGTREINLSEYLQLCAVAGADPGTLLMTGDEFRRQLLFFYANIKAQSRRDALVGMANRLYIEENPGPSAADPFGGKTPSGPKPPLGDRRRRKAVKQQ